MRHKLSCLCASVRLLCLLFTCFMSLVIEFVLLLFRASFFAVFGTVPGSGRKFIKYTLENTQHEVIVFYCLIRIISKGGGGRGVSEGLSTDFFKITDFLKNVLGPQTQLIRLLGHQNV